MLIITISYIIGILWGLYLEINIATFICSSIIILLIFSTLIILYLKEIRKKYEKTNYENVWNSQNMLGKIRKFKPKNGIDGEAETEPSIHRSKKIIILFLVSYIIIIIAFVIAYERSHKFEKLYNEINLIVSEESNRQK